MNKETFKIAITRRRIMQGVAVAIGVFAALGTVAALWENPLFVRMTPTAGPEISLLALLALLSGIFVAVRCPACAGKRATAAGLLGFVGVACPVCNKILLYAFGSELLLTYFEPIRIYVTAAGVLVMGWLILREYRQWNLVSPPTHADRNTSRIDIA